MQASMRSSALAMPSTTTTSCRPAVIRLQQRQSSSRPVVVRAEPQQNEQTPQTPQTPLTPPVNPMAPPPPPPNMTAEQKAEAEKPLILQKGQGTAVWTGVVSVVFGVAYLVLVFVMDWRGGEMLPPPPEAFGP